MKIALITLFAVSLTIVTYTYGTFLKTVYLITRITPPYEQVGTGEKKLLLLGDSTGYGTGAATRNETTAGRIGIDYPELTIFNRSVNGRTAEQLLSGVTTLEGKYDIILFQIGANDLLAGEEPATVVARIEALASAAAPHTDRIIVLTSGNVGAAWRFQGEKAETFTNVSREYDTLMKASAERNSYDFVSLFTEPEVDPFMAQPKKYIAIDGLHPTSAGYLIWYTGLRPFLDTYLKRDSN